MIYFFLLTTWVNLFTGGSFGVSVTPDLFSVRIDDSPNFNWYAYGETSLHPDNYVFEYDFYCVQIVGGVSRSQYVKTREGKAVFNRIDADLTVFTVVYRPVGKTKSDGSGTSVVMGQVKMVVPSNTSTGTFSHSMLKP